MPTDPSGDSNVRIYDATGRLVGTIDATTRERRDLRGQVISVLADPLADPAPPAPVRRNDYRLSPSIPFQRQARKTRIKGTNG